MKFYPLIRKIKKQEIPFLDEMLYNAIFIPEGTDKLPRDIIRLPELEKYIRNFGRIGDICLVAELEGTLTGAIWTRLFPADDKAYGFVDCNTPELSMAVLEQYRSRGAGAKLMSAMLEELTRQGFSSVSLSVDKQNYAYHFYLKYGFEIVEATDKSAIMVKHLQ